MDEITQQLVSFTASYSDSVLTETVREVALLHLVDSVACAIAGYDTEAAGIAIRMARKQQIGDGALVFGEGIRATPERAAFANTIMVRGVGLE